MTPEEEQDPIVRLLTSMLNADPPAEAVSRMRSHLAGLQTQFESPQVGFADRAKTIRLPRGMRWAAISAVSAAAIAAIAFLLPLQATSRAWAEVLAAVQAKDWLHAVGRGPRGERLEIWHSFPMGVTAMRQERDAVLWDSKLGTIDRYDAAQEAVVRMPMSNDDRDRIGDWNQFLVGMLKAEGAQSQKVGQLSVRHKEERTVEENGKKWTEHQLALERDGKVIGEMAIRVDPATDLPLHWKFSQHVPGATKPLVYEFDFAYPATGPVGIYALGIPPTAPLIDRTQPGDEAALLAGLRAGRERFDKYHAVVVSSSATAHWSKPSMVYQSWRDGDRWRVDRTYGMDYAMQSPPNHTDPQQWWLEQVRKRPFLPDVVSDGKQVCIFKIPRSGQSKTRPSVVAIKSIEKNIRELRFYELGNNGYELYFPEVFSHPHIPESPSYRFSIDKTPASGPQGTVLLELRAPKPNVRGIVGRRYWIDTHRGYLVVRFEMIKSTSEGEVASDVWMVEDVGLSPQGFWYPKAIRTKDSSMSLDTGERSDEIYRYYLDFDATISDSLFDLSADPVIPE